MSEVIQGINRFVVLDEVVCLEQHVGMVPNPSASAHGYFLNSRPVVELPRAIPEMFQCIL